jgi:hypothetical protein
MISGGELSAVCTGLGEKAFLILVAEASIMDWVRPAASCIK